MSADTSGILFVISAPSGTGKSTLARRLVEEVPDLRFSISYTTRPRRAGEEQGEHYHFVDDDRFDAMVRDGQFLEWAPVFERRYGTGIGATREALARGEQLLLDIDVQGARQVRASGEPCVSILLLPPSFDVLEQRLRTRGSETASQRDGRLSRARDEVRDFRDFDYVVVNNELEQAVSDLVAIVRAERRRTERVERQAQTILATFPANDESLKRE